MKAAQWAMVAMGFAAMCGATAQILFKKANVELSIQGLLNGWLLAGLALYGVGFIINLVAYKYGDASILYPIIALSYIGVVVLARVFLGEAATWNKVVGALVIVGGVLLIVW